MGAGRHDGRAVPCHREDQRPGYGDFARIRADLEQTGCLQGLEVTVRSITPSGHETRIELAAGDRIRFLTRNDELGVVNGTVGTVTRVTSFDIGQKIDEIRIEAKVGGRRISFTPDDLAEDQGRARLGWAYATTVYSAQGMTVDRAAVLLDPAFDRHAIHVAASRAREPDSRPVVNPPPPAAERPLDRQDEPVEAADTERRKWLSERLSRAVAKTSTLDSLDWPGSGALRNQFYGDLTQVAEKGHSIEL